MKKIVIALVGLLILAGCTSKTNEKEKPKNKNELSIVTSFYPMYDFTKKVVGDQADVHLLIEAGVEPHDYEPSAKDMAKIQEADVFIYNSNEMETWVKDVLKGIDTKKVKVIEASKGIPLLESNETDEEHSEEGHEHTHAYDPHVWLSPVLAKKEVETIEQGISSIDEKNKELYEKNRKTYTDKLEQLNQEYVKATKEATQRKFVTQHQAFSYLAAQYNLIQVPISGISPEQEPTPKELKKIQDVVTKEKIDVIYTESSASSKVAKTIADATGAKLVELNPLESLSSQEKKAGADYISIMSDNLSALKESIH
ncbi:metal ABC transporter solute-binding protein, Zn/Mn family [Vagococcus sp.]|uniref:metal ABC transporter solute-binding protein, Zn/Mn family n=1 Tax=Vagococcus sp. TaxID=1933889 RepID=UPI003F9B0C16